VGYFVKTLPKHCHNQKDLNNSGLFDLQGINLSLWGLQA
jgi:hypothetical protein